MRWRKQATKAWRVGEIWKRTGMPASTLAHHLRFLADAGLIERRREGRNIISRADFGHLETLAGYILKECCADENEAENG